MAASIRTSQVWDMKPGSSQTEIDIGEAAITDSALVELVRLLARQAARQYERRPEHDNPAPAVPVLEQQ